MNLDDYSAELRPVLTGDQLRRMVGPAKRDPDASPTIERLSEAAELLEGIPEDELVGLHVDCRALADDPEQPPEVRDLAAALASVTEDVITGGLCDWDKLQAAGKAANAVRRSENFERERERFGL